MSKVYDKKRNELLINEYFKGNKNALDTFYNENINTLIGYFSKKFHGLSNDDYRSIIGHGLARSLKLYNPNKNASFATFLMLITNQLFIQNIYRKKDYSKYEILSLNSSLKVDDELFCIDMVEDKTDEIFQGIYIDELGKELKEYSEKFPKVTRRFLYDMYNIELKYGKTINQGEKAKMLNITRSSYATLFQELKRFIKEYFE